MKRGIQIGVLVFLAVAVATTVVPYSPAMETAQRYFSADEINRGQQFALERRLLFWAVTAVQLGFLTWLVASGRARRLADWFLARTGNRWLAAVLLMGGFCFLAEELLTFPFSLARLEHLRAWGMTQRTFTSWLLEHGLSLIVTAISGALPLLGLYALIRFLPRSWPAPAALGTGLLAAGFAFVLPVLIAPLFNRFTPLRDTEWASLQPRVEALARKVGLPVGEVLVCDASRQGNHSNAYFTGLGASQQIVLYDNLLRKHTPPEVESVLGHELGHWRNHHIVKGILLGTLAAFAGFALLAWVLRRAAGRGLLHSPHDPAGVPLILLLAAIGAWLALPLQNLVARQFEREADQAALELAGAPEVFIAAEKKLARDNLGNVAPTPWNVWLFATHPTAVERIRMAEDWTAKNGTPRIEGR